LPIDLASHGGSQARLLELANMTRTEPRAAYTTILVDAELDLFGQMQIDTLLSANFGVSFGPGTAHV
jgi:hypothetical protein